MTRLELNRFLASLPILLSGLAFAIVMVVLTTGWERNLKDEGTAAHLFQLLIAAQLPLILAYLMTANWSHWRNVAGRIVLQLAAIVVALAPVAYFRL